MMKNIFGNRSGERESVRQWDELIDKILEGDVVPVFGPEFMALDEEHPDLCVNPHQSLIDMLAESKGIEAHHASFSQLLYDDNFPASERKEIYDMLGEAFENETDDYKIFYPSTLIMRLLNVCKFRFVITTSFTPIIEHAMRSVWKGNVRIMNFSNNPLENDDITNEDEINKPTVYYMFGRVSRKSERYVVNDSDMLSFCRTWLSDPPRNLVNILRNKYLLFLGNNYSDWLCRFIWYSMKKETNTKTTGMMVDENAEESLLQFMKRIDAFTHRDPMSVVSRIEMMIESKLKEADTSGQFHPNLHPDVFISYSRRDAAVVNKLYNSLKSRGLRVWYDRNDLGIGDKFMDEIKLAIKRTRLFIPVLSHNIQSEKNESHPYRMEWSTAINVSSGYGRNFIIPVCEQGFDFYSSFVPEEFQKHNAEFYDPDNCDFTDFSNKLFDFLMTL